MQLLILMNYSSRGKLGYRAEFNLNYRLVFDHLYCPYNYNSSNLVFMSGNIFEQDDKLLLLTVEELHSRSKTGRNQFNRELQ